MMRARPALRRRRTGLVLTLLLLLLTALPLLACGKKAEPSPPPGELNTYPRHYPNE